MKIVVIGGSGLIGTKVVKTLTEQGHEALAASPSTGVDATTGRGLAEALARAEKKAGVRHHVALSVVGTDRLPDNGYFRAKLAQERLIKTAGIPYSVSQLPMRHTSTRGKPASGILRRHHGECLCKGLVQSITRARGFSTYAGLECRPTVFDR